MYLATALLSTDRQTKRDAAPCDHSPPAQLSPLRPAANQCFQAEPYYSSTEGCSPPPPTFPVLPLSSAVEGASISWLRDTTNPMIMCRQLNNKKWELLPDLQSRSVRHNPILSIIEHKKGHAGAKRVVILFTELMHVFAVKCPLACWIE